MLVDYCASSRFNTQKLKSSFMPCCHCNDGNNDDIFPINAKKLHSKDKSGPIFQKDTVKISFGLMKLFTIGISNNLII